MSWEYKVTLGADEFAEWSREINTEKVFANMKWSGVITVVNDMVGCNVEWTDRDDRTNISYDTASKLYNEICLAAKRNKIDKGVASDLFQMVSACANQAVVESKHFEEAAYVGRKVAKALLDNKEIRNIIQTGRSYRGDVSEYKNRFGSVLTDWKFDDTDIEVIGDYNYIDGIKKRATENLEKAILVMCDALDIDRDNVSIEVKRNRQALEASFYARASLFRNSEKEIKMRLDMEVVPYGSYIGFMSNVLLRLYAAKQFQDYAELRDNSNDDWCEKNGKIPEEVMCFMFPHIRNNNYNLCEQKRFVAQQAFIKAFDNGFLDFPNTERGQKLQDIVIKKLDKPYTNDELRGISNLTKQRLIDDFNKTR